MWWGYGGEEGTWVAWCWCVVSESNMMGVGEYGEVVMNSWSVIEWRIIVLVYLWWWRETVWWGGRKRLFLLTTHSMAECGLCSWVGINASRFFVHAHVHYGMHKSYYYTWWCRSKAKQNEDTQGRQLIKAKWDSNQWMISDFHDHRSNPLSHQGISAGWEQTQVL